MIEIPQTIFDGDIEAIDALDTPAPFRFYATTDGWMVDKNTFFGRVIVPTEKNPFAKKPEWPAKGYWDIPPLPAEILSQAWGFFLAAWNKRQSEAMVHLLRVDDQYALHVPKQRASMGGVHSRLDPAELPVGATIVGSIHSHCNFSAFHSGTDQADAKKNDGLHITVGEVDKTPAQWAVMLSYSGFIWNLEYGDFTDAPLDSLTPTDPPEGWLERIDEPPKWQGSTAVIPHKNTRASWAPTPWGQSDLWDDYWEWKHYGGNGHYKPTPEPITTTPKNQFASLDQMIRSGILGNLREEDAEMLELVENDLIGLADILSREFSILLDFTFTDAMTDEKGNPISASATTNPTTDQKENNA